MEKQLLQEIIEDLRNIRQSIARREGERIHFNKLDALESKYQHRLKELEDK